MSRPKKKSVPSSPLLAKRLREWYASKSPVLRFGTQFGLLVVLLYIILAIPFFDRMLYGYLEINAWLSHFILNIFGQHTQISEGVIIQSPKFSVAIRRGCDAVEPTWLFCAALVSFRASWRQKFIGMAAGIVILQALNLIRIVTLYGIGIYLPSFFNPAHVEVWPMVFIAIAILLFVRWIKWTIPKALPDAAP